MIFGVLLVVPPKPPCSSRDQPRNLGEWRGLRCPLAGNAKGSYRLMVAAAKVESCRRWAARQASGCRLRGCQATRLGWCLPFLTIPNCNTFRLLGLVAVKTEGRIIHFWGLLLISISNSISLILGAAGTPNIDEINIAFEISNKPNT